MNSKDFQYLIARFIKETFFSFSYTKRLLFDRSQIDLANNGGRALVLNH